MRCLLCSRRPVVHQVGSSRTSSVPELNVLPTQRPANAVVATIQQDNLKSTPTKEKILAGCTAIGEACEIATQTEGELRSPSRTAGTFDGKTLSSGTCWWVRDGCLREPPKLAHVALNSLDAFADVIVAHQHHVVGVLARGMLYPLRQNSFKLLGQQGGPAMLRCCPFIEPHHLDRRR